MVCKVYGINLTSVLISFSETSPDFNLIEDTYTAEPGPCLDLGDPIKTLNYFSFANSRNIFLWTLKFCTSQEKLVLNVSTTFYAV